MRTNLVVAKAAAVFQTKRDERGATAVEYGLMVALIAIVIVVAVALLGNSLAGLFGDAATTI